MCLNGNLLLKDKDYDRVFVGNDPVNWIDPWGLELSKGAVDPYDIDYGGPGSWAQPSGPNAKDECLTKCIKEHYGLTGSSLAAVLAGQPNIGTKSKNPSAQQGTSLASKLSRKIKGGKRRHRSLVGIPPKIRITTPGGAIGRAIPVAGWLALGADAAIIAACVKECECKD